MLPKVWIARITFTDRDGIRKAFTRNALTKTEAGELLDELRQKMKDLGLNITRTDSTSYTHAINPTEVSIDRYSSEALR